MSYILKVICLFSLFLVPLIAIVQEDAEDKKSSRWEIVFSPTEAHIENYYDRQKKSRVIHFEGEGIKSIYKFNAMKKEKIKRESGEKYEYWLSWEMQYSRDFVIILILQTTKGESYLIYTSGNHNSYNQFGLGDEILDGEWHTIKRNIQDDLDYFDNRQEILSIKTFVIKGDGSIDNIETRVKKIEEQKSKKESKTKLEPISLEHNSLPIIKIKGNNPQYLDLGESYVEEGVEAYDKEDGKVEVDSIDDINSNEEGVYMVMYMARDSQGDVSIDRRVVIVGNGSVDKEQEEDTIKEEHDELTLKEKELDEKEYKMRLWEKELALKEKHLKEIAKN